MRDLIEAKLRALARRAGMGGVPTPVLVATMVLLCVAVVAALLRWWPHPADGTVVRVQSSGAAQSASGGAADASASLVRSPSAAETSTVCVDVVGAVHHPGVYTLADGTRVQAAVEAAGGLTSAAAPVAINLAAKVADGEQIVVPTQAQVDSGAVPTGATGTGAPGKAGGAAGAKINLNTADATALDALPGVGPSTAAKIVADRQQNGPFKSPDDLGRVPGIGPKKLDALKPLICVR